MFLESVSLWQLTESHLCFVAHLHLQRAAWVGMLIRCVHLRTNPFEYYDNIWQTSSTEWQGWPTASENYCLSRNIGPLMFFPRQTIFKASRFNKLCWSPECFTWSANTSMLLGWISGVWTASKSFYNIQLFFKLNRELRIQMFH